TGMGRSLHEVVKHLSLVNLAVDTSILTMNKSKFDALPEDLQKVLIESAKERDAEQFDLVEEYVKVALQTFEDKGMTVHRIAPEDREEMKTRTASAIEEWAGQISNGEEYLKIVSDTAQ